MMDISFIIPTFNSEKYIIQCIDSIISQELQNITYEIIVIDANSSDTTLKKIQKYNELKILKNRFKTGEAGKKIGIDASSGKYLCLVDSDNILNPNYIKRSLRILNHENKALGLEPIKFKYDKSFGLIDNYCSLAGVNDPLNLYFKNFDKLSYFYDTWTKCKYEIINENDEYIFCSFDSEVPTFGANGTIIIGDIARKYSREIKHPYFFDNDFIIHLFKKTNNLKFIKIKLDLTHHYCGNSFRTFYKKQRRRVNDFLFYENIREVDLNKKKKINIIIFILDCIFVFPLLYKSLKVFFKTKKKEILIHIFICWITLYVYSLSSVIYLKKREKYN